MSRPRVDDGEGNACHDQHHQRADRGMCVQQMLDALERDCCRSANCSAADAGACGSTEVVTWASLP